MTTGENDNTWGDQTNDNLKRLENKITGYAAVTLSGTTHTLTFTDNPTSYADEDGRNFVLNFGGSPGGTCTVTIPARETVYLVLNNTADSNDITLTTGSGTTFTVPSGKDAFVYSDGTNVYNGLADVVTTTLDTGAITTTGITSTGNINLGDNDKAQFGASQDLQIYHDATAGNSYIKDNGTGYLILQASTNLQLRGVNNEVFLNAGENGSVDLYYDNVKKLETTSTGADVRTTTSGAESKLRVSSNNATGDNDATVVISNSGSGDAMLRFDYEESNTDRARIGVTSSSQALKFYTGGNNQRMVIDNTGVDVTGTVTADGISLGDNETINVGASNDLQIFHDGSNSYIKDEGAGELKITTNGTAIQFQKGVSEIIARFVPDGNNELYYDNSKKLETTSSGATVTGTLTGTQLAVSGAATFRNNTGDYGSIEITGGATNSFTGYSIEGQIAFMQNGSIGGIYNDINNQWILKSTYNGATTIQHAGSDKLATTSSGVDVTGQVLADKAYIAEATLTDGATISWNMSTQSVAKVTLGGNRTLSAPTNGSTGQFCSINVIQDGTGSRTLTWNAVFEFKDDTAPTLTTTASKGDLFVFRYNGSKWLEVGRNLNISQS
jgi:hypothetical protein